MYTLAKEKVEYIYKIVKKKYLQGFEIIPLLGGVVFFFFFFFVFLRQSVVFNEVYFVFKYYSQILFA